MYLSSYSLSASVGLLALGFLGMFGFSGDIDFALCPLIGESVPSLT